MLFGSFQSDASAILRSHLAHSPKNMLHSNPNLTNSIVNLQLFLREWIVTVALPHHEVFGVTVRKEIVF